MPRTIPAVQDALRGLFADPVKALYANTPALMDAVENNKLTPRQVIEQGIVYAAQIKDRELRGIHTTVLMPHLKMVFRVSTSQVMEAAVPLLELPANTPEHQVAGATLGLAGAVSISAAFGQSARFPEVGSYLVEHHRRHPDRSAPFGLISLVYSIHPNAALETMWTVYKIDAQSADQTRRWIHEVDGMIVDFLVHRDTPEQRRRLLEIISQAAKSPHWPIRLYAAALVRRPELRRLEIPDPFPKGDEHEIVARFLQEVPLHK